MPGVHTLPAPWGALADAAGGVTALTKVLDVNQSTIWRWAHGHKAPNNFVQQGVNALCERYGIKPVFTVGDTTHAHEEKVIEDSEAKADRDAEVPRQTRKEERANADAIASGDGRKRGAVGRPKGRNAQSQTGGKARPKAGAKKAGAKAKRSGARARAPNRNPAARGSVA